MADGHQKLQGKEHVIKCLTTETVGDLKARIYDITNVMPQRQKLFGLKAPGKQIVDEMLISSFSSSPSAADIFRFMLMGTPESAIPIESCERPHVLDDFEFDYVPTAEEAKDSASRERKLKKIVAKTQISFIHPLEPHKKLLVLDLDHTLFDFSARDKVPRLIDVARPGLEHFLVSVWQHYNIAIWSQTSWRWLEVKLTELGMLTHPRFRISFVLDKSHMFSVKSYRKEKGEVIRHEVKALPVIWQHLPQYSHKNTLHIDDLARNFVMNPKNGVRVSAFYIGPDANSDKELFQLAKYLARIAPCEDVSSVSHEEWREAMDES